MIRKIPQIDYLPNEVVFIRDNKQMLKPAKIFIKSSYGTYKVKVYGTKQQQYVNQYLIQPYTQQKASQSEQLYKKNKKHLKYLKTAQKDHQTYKQKIPQIKIPKHIKQQQQDLEQDIICQQNGFQNISNKYQAIIHIKIENIINDFKNNKDTIFSYTQQGVERICREKSKWLLIQRLAWALQDIEIGRSNLSTQRTISQIMDSDTIQPVQYLQTCLFKRLGIAIQYCKRNKIIKLKNYLVNKQSSIITGIDNYMNNYSVFLRIRDNFIKFLNGDQIKIQEQSISKQHEQHSQYPELNLTK